MPLNRPALTLGSGPSDLHEARRWVVSTCLDIGRPDLVECAEIGVSELVTNALLHAGPPIRVRVRGTREHPRVEVVDISREPPVLPGAGPLTRPDDGDDLLLTFGRGLGIVARCSTAWGAEIEEDGKVVWFNPAPEFNEGDGVPGVITGVSEPTANAFSRRQLVNAEIRGLPLRTFQDFQVHYRELRREVRLLALAHEADYPLATNLSHLFDTLDKVLREGIAIDQLERTLASGHDSTDLHIAVPLTTVNSIDRFLELLDQADAFCREERLLTLARSPEQREFQQWFLSEIVRQHRGEEPSIWVDSVTDQGRTSVG